MRAVMGTLGVTLALGAYVFPYLCLAGNWWRFIPSTALILFLGWVFKKRHVWEFLGLRLSVKAFGLSVALFLILQPVFSFAIFHMVVQPPLAWEGYFYLPSQTHQFFQVLNDELLRAALLTTLLGTGLPPTILAVFTAAAFAAAHQAFYGLQSIDIHWTTMITLFSFSAIANSVFIRFRHIGYSFALHYAWNFYRFNRHYYLDGKRLSEGVTFNYIEGNPWVATTCFVAFVVVIVSYERSRPVI